MDLSVPERQIMCGHVQWAGMTKEIKISILQVEEIIGYIYVEK